VEKLTVLVLFCICTFISSAYGQVKVPQKIEYIKSDDKTNQIPYFDNRFRLDAQLKEITMLFYHKSGSVPVILVRPDGSKLRVKEYDKDKVEWYDDATFDMIKIKKPMPGPWQVVGDVLPNSQILIVSDVKIAVDPLPDVMLAGETLKMEGTLFNGNLAINNPKFRNVVQLNVVFISTNNASYENFGSDYVDLTTFRDDGLELDEYANDGIFTGEFQLTIPPGEWVPLYRIKLPMATRELRQKPIVLRKNPVSMKVDVASYEGEYHTVHFVIDPKYVDADSFIFQGQITYPDKQVEPFSVTEKKGVDHTKKFAYTEPGIHRINVNAFGRTINGREFRLVVPEFTFNVEVNVDDLKKEDNHQQGRNDMAAPKQAIAEGDTSTKEQLAQEQAKLTKMLAEQKLKAANEQKQQWLIIGVGNLIIIVLGLAFFFILRKRNKNK